MDRKVGSGGGIKFSLWNLSRSCNCFIFQSEINEYLAVSGVNPL